MAEWRVSDVMSMTIMASMRYRTDAADKSLSCPICGKNFPRGGVDLDRHCSAKTLSHYATTQKIPEVFVFKCTCNLYFSSPEHLELHRQTICKDTGPHERILPVPVHTTSRIGAPQPFQGKKPHGNSKLAKMAKELEEKRAKENDEEESEVGGKKRKNDDGGEQSSHGVGKRMRIVDPLDRKTFFAIISLLIPPEAVGPKTRITTHNFEEFIPKAHVRIVNKLKEKLNWSA